MTKKDTPTCEERLGLNLEINKSSNIVKTKKRDYQVGKSCHVSKNKLLLSFSFLSLSHLFFFLLIELYRCPLIVFV